MPANETHPARGDIWLADLNPVRGYEQAGLRPVLVISVDRFNQSRANLLIVVPLTSTQRRHPFHVTIEPPEGGLSSLSNLLCEAVRSISKDRFIRRWGVATEATMEQVEDRLRILLGL